MKKTRSPFFWFCPRDFLASAKTQVMTTTEIGAYFLLLANAWLNDPCAHLPADEEFLRRLCRMTPAEWAESRERIMACWNDAGNGLIVNARLLRTKQEQDEFYEKKRAAGQYGNSIRWADNGKRIANVSHCDSNAIANVSPPTPSARVYTEATSVASCSERFAESSEPAASPPISSEPTETTAETPLQKAPAAVGCVPEDLRGLALYSEDARLCGRWDELKTAWTTAYPGVDVLAEVRKAHAWETANPSRRKVQRARFLSGWLSRAQDAARPGPRAWQRPEDDKSWMYVGLEDKEGGGA